MNVAITTTGPTLDANVDSRFGRCPCFLIVNTDSLDFEAVENPNLMLGSGAGIQSAQLMAEKDVKFVLTGNCGPKAYQTLSAAGIGVIAGCGGTAADVLEQFKAGQLDTVDAPNVPSKSGLAGAPSPDASQPAAPQQPPVTGGVMGAGGRGGRGMGMGRGGGMGKGRGQGGGRGRGMGQGMGQGRGQGMGSGFAQGPGAMPQQPTEGLSGDDEIAILKEQAEAMARQMQQIQERIKQLEQEG